MTDNLKNAIYNNYYNNYNLYSKKFTNASNLYFSRFMSIGKLSKEVHIKSEEIYINVL